MKTLNRVQFGNPILRKRTKKLSLREINSAKIQTLINNMHYTLEAKDIGVGLAAPQVGENLAIAVINIHPTTLRPKVKESKFSVVNPKIIEASGTIKYKWEGCISSGDQGRAGLFAKVPRYTSVKVSYLDSKGKEKLGIFTGLEAHVLQHEIDHLEGVLFVDKVKDPKTFMTYKEYMKRIKRR